MRRFRDRLQAAPDDVDVASLVPGANDFDYDSEEWRHERELFLLNSDGVCERCGVTPEHPHIHHKYGTQYRDYELLCADCHAEHHGDWEIAHYGKQMDIGGN